MNNAKKGKTKTAPKRKAALPKSGQSNKKPAKAKSAATAKSGAGKSPATAKKATAKVFRVDVKKGPIRTVPRVDAIKDALRNDTFSEEALNAMLDKGEVIPSPDYYYATSEKALSKWAIDEAPESKPLEVGDYVYSADREVVGEVRDHDSGSPRIFFLQDGHLKSVAVTAKWGRASKEQIEAYKTSQALEKDAAAEAEVIPAMTPEEKSERDSREEVVKVNLAAQENASMVIGENLHAIRTKSLWRESVDPNTSETFKRFGDYAVVTFGLSREYAQNLAQLAPYHQIAMEVAPARIKDAGLSVNVTNALVRSLNQQTKDLGLDDIDGFEDFRPIITGTLKVLADVAPKNKQTGKAEISPRLVRSVTDVIGEIVKSGSVEIEGKQISIADAAEKGVLGAATQGQVLETVAEGIKANRQTLVDEARQAYERATTPSRPAGSGSKKPFFSGKVPSLKNMSCERDGRTKVISIGNGTFQTACKCRWRIDSESGELVCFEVKGRPVKPAE